MDRIRSVSRQEETVCAMLSDLTRKHVEPRRPACFRAKRSKAWHPTQWHTAPIILPVHSPARQDHDGQVIGNLGPESFDVAQYRIKQALGCRGVLAFEE